MILTLIGFLAAKPSAKPTTSARTTQVPSVSPTSPTGTTSAPGVTTVITGGATSTPGVTTNATGRATSTPGANTNGTPALLQPISLDGFGKEALDVSNTKHSIHNASPFQLDSSLNQQAQSYAETLAAYETPSNNSRKTLSKEVTPASKHNLGYLPFVY